MITTIQSKQVRFTLVALLLMASLPTARADDNGAKRLFIESMVHKQPPFLVQVDVNHQTRIYRGGEVLTATVKSSKDGYLYLFNCDVKGNVWCLFPNKHQKQNRIQANQKVNIPMADKFKIRVGAPYGTEFVKAIVTTKPVKAFEIERLITTNVTPMQEKDGKRLFIELNDRDQEARRKKEKRDWQWAEHSVKITTIDPKRKPSAHVRRIEKGEHRRIGLFVGISFYESEQVRRSLTCQNDAKSLKAKMEKLGQLDSAILLLNKQATREAIEQTICNTIANQTGPGDTVFIFLSCHGGRYKDPVGGTHDYLVPFDAKINNLNATLNSTISDVVLSRWLQNLKGRKVTILLDACHAGGILDQGKNFGQPFFAKLAANIEGLKELGQKYLGLLASCLSHQRSFIRRERDHSVMTYYLLDAMDHATKSLNLEQWHRTVKQRVEKYVEQTYRSKQTPVLVGHEVSNVMIKPN